jgi:hypothetical protein
MVARTVTFSAPCLRARSHVVLSCFCTSSHWTPGCGWIATYVTMVMGGASLIHCGCLATRQANTRMLLHG